MFVSNIQLPGNKWTEIASANTGDLFYIQNLTAGKIRYIVSATEPTDDDYGCVLAPGQQLVFKKISGDLYMRGNGHGTIAIEQKE